ncbi:MAG: hypothetical protein C0467_07060 [Planctomycetaceae bacterium]|nr:hypothetical protein [Planctomycetaceae bacterium]
MLRPVAEDVADYLARAELGEVAPAAPPAAKPTKRKRRLIDIEALHAAAVANEVQARRWQRESPAVTGSFWD